MKPLMIQPEADEAGTGRLFRKLMLQVAVVAAVTHVAFSALFYIHEVDFLAAVNVVSVLLYGVVYWLMVVDQYRTFAWALAVGEIVGHAMLAVFLIGWDSGFHLYIMLIPPVMMVSPIRSSQVKMIAVTTMMMTYVLMDYSLRGGSAVFSMPAPVLTSLHYFNLVAVLVLMVFLTGLYYRLVLAHQKKLKELATTDSLTGLQNRRSIQFLAEREIENHRRTNARLSVLMCDLDKFKSINDDYGHQVGDEVIKSFAALVTRLIRQGDLAARWGGEEFLLILPSTSADEALYVAERIRNELQLTQVVRSMPDLAVTTTMGISELLETDSFDALVARADKAMYQGKEGGRNQVNIA